MNYLSLASSLDDFDELTFCDEGISGVVLVADDSGLKKSEKGGGKKGSYRMLSDS